ncbi:hypothetical protein DL768_004159 [Monosporascus sp. mg162]|nr:hypothetical protein DL768_004159 [Monosporascus sp. mg162]
MKGDPPPISCTRITQPTTQPQHGDGDSQSKGSAAMSVEQDFEPVFQFDDSHDTLGYSSSTATIPSPAPAIDPQAWLSDGGDPELFLRVSSAAALADRFLDAKSGSMNLSQHVDAAVGREELFPFRLVLRHEHPDPNPQIPHVALESRPQQPQVRVQQRTGEGSQSGGRREHVLHKAILNGSVDIVRLLLEYHAPVDMPDSGGMAPLHLATIRKDCSLVTMLLLHGADIDSRDASGRTPLDYAVEMGDFSVVEILLAHGADMGGV